jgi:hypothetical protein
MWRLLRIPLLIFCSILFALLLVEAALRLVGYRLPPKSGFHTQGWAQRNELLGWCYRPGTWRVDCEQRPMTILDDRSRKVTGGKPNQNGPTILLVGCSYAAGYGVTDDESMASRIQTYYSGVRVINLATPGYGTYQSYLILKKYLDEHANTPPNVVVYGYAGHQPIRNVADWRWISSLKSYSGGQIVQPHLEKQENNTWKEVPFIEHNLLSMSGVSSLVFMIQSVMLERRYGTKSDNLHIEATNYSMLLMDRLCSNRDIAFITINIFNQYCPVKIVTTGNKELL